MPRGPDWDGGGLMFARPAPPPAVSVPASASAPFSASVPVSVSAHAHPHPALVSAPAQPPLNMLQHQHLYSHSHRHRSDSASRRNARAPGGVSTLRSERQRDYEPNTSFDSPSPTFASSSPPPLSSPSPTRQRSASASTSRTAHTPSADDHDPILPHTQAYHQALRHATGGSHSHSHSQSHSTSHSPYSTFPSFIAVGPPLPTSTSSSPRKRSHSPGRAAQSKRTPSSTSKPKSRPSSPTKPRSQPASPTKAKPQTSRTPTPPHSQHNARAQPRITICSTPTTSSFSHSTQQVGATGSRSRPTTPSTPTFAVGAGRSRIPQRPRAYSASSAAEALETPADQPPLPPPPPPPLPPLPLPDHRAHESALAGVKPPRQAFPGATTTLTLSHTPDTMSVSTRAAPEALRLPGATNSSGIPVLKTRVRSSARSPSPDFPDGAERLADELPPFRVDLDAALAEIEDEIEVRAHERYASALPAPRTPTPNSATFASAIPRTPTPNSATYANITPGSTPPSSIGPASVGAQVSKIRPPKQRPRQSTPNGGSTSSLPVGSTPPVVTRGGKPRSGSMSNTPQPTTPRSKDRLGRAASYSNSPDGRSKSMPRRRHGSDTAQLAVVGRRPSNSPAISTPPVGRRAAGPRTSTNARSNSMSNRGNAPNPSPPTQSQSKLGVAAHFVPPESTFTPPKGADWDDVVLPTVARKTGITVSQNGASLGNGHRRGNSYSQSYNSHSANPSVSYSVGSTQPHTDETEDLLATEWDKEGTPIRWERQRTREGLSEDDFAANRAAAGTTAGTPWGAGVDDFGAPSKPDGLPISGLPGGGRRSHDIENIEMATFRNPPTQLQPAPQATPTRPPRAGGRGSAAPSPQMAQTAFAQPRPQPDRPPPLQNLTPQSPQQQQFPRPMEISTPKSPKSPRTPKHGRKRRDGDDIKTGGCGCVIM